MIQWQLPPDSVVVKVGGSLYDDPRLGPGLRAYLDALDAPKILLVAGGGPFADAIRTLDHTHGLGEEASHHLAMRAISTAPYFLADILKLERFVGIPTHLFEEWANTQDAGRLIFLQLSGFTLYFEEIVRPVPHTWDFTTDSIAALAARVANARLVLLKSTDIPPGTPWAEAAERGWVDPYFPTALGDPPVPTEAINFRRWLDQHFAPPNEG